ncbi:replication-relaxation family protein [Thermotalea metallivorans]|nr:replication-relaxation family protein [Thermotalea metallivorans]
MLLLRDLYDLQILSARQIKRLYYDDRQYGYNRIRTLQAKGWLNSKPLVHQRKKETQYYYLTEMAIRKVLEGQENLKYRSSSQNRPDNKYQVERQLAINEIYITLKQLEKSKGTDIWEWLDSRKTKEKFGLNTNDYIAGCLINKKSQDRYGIYLPFKLSDKDDMKSFFTKIKNEIQKNLTISKYIIFCPDSETFEIVNKNLKTEGRAVSILPFPKGVNLLYNFLSDYEESILKLYEQHFQIPKDSIEKEPAIYATHSTAEIYLTEILTNDVAKKELIERYINDQRINKKLWVLCWTTQEKELAAIIQGSGKVFIYPISWANSELLKGIDEKEMFDRIHRTNQVPKEKKAETVGFSLWGEPLKYIKKLPKGQRSSFIQDLIESYLEGKIEGYIAEE